MASVIAYVNIEVLKELMWFINRANQPGLLSVYVLHDEDTVLKLGCAQIKTKSVDAIRDFE